VRSREGEVWKFSNADSVGLYSQLSELLCAAFGTRQ